MTRLVVLAGLALAVWLVSAPAAAAGAGLCSQRGASELAPSPLMIPAHASLEEGDAALCDGEWKHHAVQQNDRTELSPSAGADAVLPTRAFAPRPGVSAVNALGAGETPTSRGGERLERPPRPPEAA